MYSFNKNCVRKLKEKLCSKAKRKKNSKKKIHLSLPFLYCIGAYQNVKQKNNQHINQSYRLSNFVKLLNIQRTSRNRPLKGPTLGSADKYTTLLPLAWPIKSGFSLANFFVQSYFLLNSHWFATFFEVKKVGSNPASYYFRTKKSLHTKKFASVKPASRSSMSTRTL